MGTNGLLLVTERLLLGKKSSGPEYTALLQMGKGSGHVGVMARL